MTQESAKSLMSLLDTGSTSVTLPAARSDAGLALGVTDCAVLSGTLDLGNGIVVLLASEEDSHLVERMQVMGVEEIITFVIREARSLLCSLSQKTRGQFDTVVARVRAQIVPLSELQGEVALNRMMQILDELDLVKSFALGHKMTDEEKRVRAQYWIDELHSYPASAVKRAIREVARTSRGYPDIADVVAEVQVQQLEEREIERRIQQIDDLSEWGQERRCKEREARALQAQEDYVAEGFQAILSSLHDSVKKNA